MAASGVTLIASPPSKWLSSPALPSPSDLFRQRDNFENLENAPRMLEGAAGIFLDSSKYERLQNSRDKQRPIHSKLDFEAASSSILATRHIQTSSDIIVITKNDSRDKDTMKKQAIIKRGRVKKPGVDAHMEKCSDSKAGSTPKAKSSLSKYFAKSMPEDSSSAGISDGLELNKATARRLDWTPTKNTSIQGNPSRVDVLEEEAASSESSTTRFGNILGEYNYQHGEDRRSRLPQPGNTGGNFTKRRKIELDESSTVSSEASMPTKAKPSKKKPRTVTGAATASYALEEPKEVATLGGESGFTSGRTAAERTRRAPKRPKKEPIKKPRALPPEEALKKLENQDLLFGTSSQLVREDSPSLIRDLQRAIRESEVDAPQTSTSEHFSSSLRSSAQSTRTTLSTAMVGSKNLWSASARDEDGLLSGLEIVDLTGSSPFGNTSMENNPAKPPEMALKPDSDALFESDGGFVRDSPSVTQHLDEFFSAVPSSQSVFHEKSSSRSSLAGPTGSRERRLQTIDAVKESGGRLCERTAQDKPQSGSKEEIPCSVKPNFTGFSTSQLSSELSSYGFKPIKSRQQMIHLLEKCWREKNRNALQSLPTNVSIGNLHLSSNSDFREGGSGAVAGKATGSADESKTIRDWPHVGISVPSVKKAQSQSKEPPVSNYKKPHLPEIADKGSYTARTISGTRGSKGVNDDEQERLEWAASPLKSRSSLLTGPGSLAPLGPSVTSANAGGDTAHDDDDSCSDAHMLQQITRAIRAQSRSGDVGKPTWHEKILMYDPIVLEDLAVWLNTEGLATIGEDEEVGPAVVRLWCERHAVCCLWKTSVTGQARARW